ncbi:uncharacterized protein LOC128040981 [Gossypium raimondii]|uniref:uncharacterized protein LOC128040981 n=1 Tax=Gossypium raimondii TaxID=29730 RepID=UPI00227C74D4|nr:uncharacterized protein LOC128040981 [Gossypium raimondii]
MTTHTQRCCDQRSETKSVTYRFAKDWQEKNDLARACLHKASKRSKKWADRTRRMYNFKWRVGKVAYKLELPPKLKVHSVFHVSMLKPFHGDQEDPNRGKSERAPMGVKVSYDRKVENIEADRIIRQKYHRPRHEYLVRWKGLPDSEASWELAEALWQFQEKIDQFHKEDAMRASLEQVGENVMGCAWEHATMTNLCDPSYLKEVIWPNQTGPLPEEIKSPSQESDK